MPVSILEFSEWLAGHGKAFQPESTTEYIWGLHCTVMPRLITTKASPTKN